MSLLSVVVDAAGEVGAPAPNVVAGSLDQTIITLFRMANKEGRRLRDHPHPRGGWSVLQREHTFSTVASTAAYDLPSDFKKLLFETAWDRDAYWEMIGSLSPQEWQAVKSGLASSPALRKRYRIKRASSGSDRQFFIDPTPSSADSLVFEYLSDAWVRNAADDTYTDGYAADTDVSLLDEEIITQGVIWRFLASKGFAHALQLAEYERARDTAIAQDAALPRLYLAPQRFSLGKGNVPESNFGS